MQPIEFWFDFSSTYSYLLSEVIEPIAARHGRSVDYKPTLLGAVFKATGGGAPIGFPAKGRYTLRDVQRSARFCGVPFRCPTVFPVSTVSAARAVLYLQQTAPAHVTPFIHATFRAYFVDDRNISEAAVVGEVARGCGIDADALAAGIASQSIKDALKAQVDESIARGMFGAPLVFVDGEPFWGHDRLPQIERWMATGPF